MTVPFDVQETDRLLTTTRSVRKRLDLDKPVSREVVLDCLRIALQAPTGSNAQGWRWIVVDDPEVKAGLSAVYRKGFEPYFEAKRQEGALKGLPNGERIAESAWHLADSLHKVPVLVVPCLAHAPAPEAPHAEQAAAFASIYPAVWSFMLALRSRGLASALTTLHLVHQEEAAELLGIPDGVVQACMLPVAYYTGTDFRPAARRPLEEITHFNRWTGRARVTA